MRTGAPHMRTAIGFDLSGETRLSHEGKECAPKNITGSHYIRRPLGPNQSLFAYWDIDLQMCIVHCGQSLGGIPHPSC